MLHSACMKRVMSSEQNVLPEWPVCMLHQQNRIAVQRSLGWALTIMTTLQAQHSTCEHTLQHTPALGAHTT